MDRVRVRSLVRFLLIAAVVGTPAAVGAAEPAACLPATKVARVIKAEVVAIDQCLPVNRLGAVIPDGMVFALKRDVVVDAGGGVRLRGGKRPRPIVLRANVGDVLEVTFTNLLSTNTAAVSTRAVGIHVTGLPLVDAIGNDGSWVGKNTSTLVEAGQPEPERTRVYKFFAAAEGCFLLTSSGAEFGTGINAGQLTAGLFGSVTVQPAGAEWYRSQVTRADLDLCTSTKEVGGKPCRIIDYNAVYPAGAKYPDGTPIPANTPVLRMLDDNKNIVHSDLTAVITGKDHGRFSGTAFPPNPSYPERDRPYREFAIHYHDAANIAQAFADFSRAAPEADPTKSLDKYTLQNGQDTFAINYGSGGIGAEILANRLKVGPMHASPESKFEEFFLSSWVVGDPAMVVDVPANAPAKPDGPVVAGPPCEPVSLTKTPLPGPKATKAFYPDDPSNVYHSYLSDRVIFRVLHTGSNVAHVHHQHAHQWLRTSGSDASTLMDSQAITPGDAYSLEMVYGSGNRNLTVGDAIFHCHFYPHFAAGMWAMWRVHDVYEAGTELDPAGRPKPGARALPDGEIAAGTPIPGLVPMPTVAMAPDPAPVTIVPAKDPGGNPVPGYVAELTDPNDPRNPGYPFFVPGVGGRRAPHPPYDFHTENGQPLDGGLPRHVVIDGKDGYMQQNALDFTKETESLVAMELPEHGTPTEKKAMAYHQKGQHPSCTPEGKEAPFRTNGGKPKPGAPFADPTVNAYAPGQPPAPPPDGAVCYKAANIQLDAVFNKKGWHYPQQRIIALWEDVKPTLAGRRPDPLFIRANSQQEVEYVLANLVPDYYELDNFQVRTPTDVIGQHIHLVKFDVLASDGAANGFNYEDGTFAPIEVQKRIEEINKTGGLWAFGGGTRKELKAKPIPFFGEGPDAPDEFDVDGTKLPGRKAWVGAQATVQRWYADPLLNNEAQDRTLRTVFTHDHFGPSTHQQAGLYAGLIVEPHGAKWLSAETGQPLGGRADGGPTSWQAIIEHPNPLDKDKKTAFREFALEFADSQLAYGPKSPSTQKPYRRYKLQSGTPLPRWGWWQPVGTDDDLAQIVNPPANTATKNWLPSLISSGQPGTRVLNYRNEPLPLRLLQDTANPTAQPSDLAHAYRSIKRVDEAMNVQPAAGSPINPPAPNTPIDPNGFKFSEPYPGADPQDPYTPLLRAYENDPVRVRVLVGAHQLTHGFHVHGLPWLAEPSYPNSGYRSTQVMGISEHFEMDFRLPRTAGGPTQSADYLVAPSGGVDGQVTGVWSLLRAYQKPQDGVAPLPTATAAPPPSAAGVYPTREAFFSTADGRPVRKYQVVAVPADIALAGRTGADGLVYFGSGPNAIADRQAVIYVRKEDLQADGRLKPDVPVEPLVLRANAGDLIEVTLENRIPADKQIDPIDPHGLFDPQPNDSYKRFFALPLFDKPALNRKYQIRTSLTVGLHPHLLDYDVLDGNGFNVGRNPVRTVVPAQTGQPPQSTTYRWYAGRVRPAPGGGYVGEPVEFGVVNLQPADPLRQHPHGLFAALVVEPQNAKWSAAAGTHAVITDAGDKPLFQEDVLFLQTDASAAGVAANYRTEPMTRRFPPPTDGDWNAYTGTSGGVAEAVSNTLTGADPGTPVILATTDLPLRLRLVRPGGQGNDPNFLLYGHVWQRQPFTGGGRTIGCNPASDWTGSSGLLAADDQANLVVWNPGGPFKVAGDYLWRDALSLDFASGLWGLLRVTDPTADRLALDQAAVLSDSKLQLRGRVAPVLRGGKATYADSVTVTVPKPGQAQPTVEKVAVDPNTGRWRFETDFPAGGKGPDQVSVTSPLGGKLQLEAAPPRMMARAAPVNVQPPPARRANIDEQLFFRSNR